MLYIVTGDGQPENIGYGYQKTISGPQGSYSSLVEDRPPRPPSKALEKVLLEYLEDEYMNDRKNPYYHHPSVVEAKRSMFRERGGDVEAGGRLEAARKRENFVLPSSFRERIHSRGGELQDTWQQRLVENIAKDLDEESREEDNENSEERLYAIVQNLWDKYRQSKPQIINIEDMTPNDVQEIMQALSDDDVDEYKAGQDKRQGDYGGGFDYFNNAGAMGGWGGYRKRAGKQRLESNGQHGGNFLYSLKFVAPAINREAVETLRDEEGLEVPDERDEDIVRLAAALGRQVPDHAWPGGYEGPDALDELYGPSDDAYQRLSMAPPLSRKRYPAYTLQEVPPSSEILVPDKKFIYEDRRKRYPVTKRSSNFYASPPLLHHKSLSGEDMKEVRKKKDSVVGKTSEFTDPKVAQELNQIFSSDDNDVSGHSKLASSEKNGKSENNSTDQPPVTASKVENKTEKMENKNYTAVNPDMTEDHGTKHESHHHDEEIIEQPITMSRIQIKKKSTDLSDYFGIDRRRKKTGPMNSDKSESINSENQIDDDWLLHQYYKTLAMASIPLKMRSSSESSLLPTMVKKMEQPFDTRLFKPDIFSRSAMREASKKSSTGSSDDSKIDNMDSKLRNIEDLIVNEAVKYTGSHESAEDPREIQEVKDKILSRLAAAYSLEKMRLALSEFKTSLQAQKMSQYNPENRQSSSMAESDDDNKKKRVAIKKEKAEDKNETKDEEKKRDDHGKDFDDEETSGEFLEGPVDVEPMSEGYMGKSDTGRAHGNK